ncbi:hypothetical protein HYX70_03510 [Candidatus Saccharibacteria bacterium]|nr:hypothetical protein [Candidatus Saccharibacteria bacterium]
MKKTKRQVKNISARSLKNMPQSVKYQRTTQSFGATGHFKARHFLMMALLCFLLTQVIKFVLYSIIFRGEATPAGAVFSFVVYVQIVLLLSAFGFLIIACIKALRGLIRAI